MKWRKRTIKIKKEILLKFPTSSQSRLKLIENSLKAIEPKRRGVSFRYSLLDRIPSCQRLSMQFNFHQKRTVRGKNENEKHLFSRMI